MYPQNVVVTRMTLRYSQDNSKWIHERKEEPVGTSTDDFYCKQVHHKYDTMLWILHMAWVSLKPRAYCFLTNILGSIYYAFVFNKTHTSHRTRKEQWIFLRNLLWFLLDRSGNRITLDSSNPGTVLEYGNHHRLLSSWPYERAPAATACRAARYYVEVPHIAAQALGSDHRYQSRCVTVKGEASRHGLQSQGRIRLGGPVRLTCELGGMPISNLRLWHREPASASMAHHILQ